MAPESKPGIPHEATETVRIVDAVLCTDVVAIYLFGSAVAGGLRVDSDVDLLAVTGRRLTDNERHRLVAELLDASGQVGAPKPARPIELTVLNYGDVVPWRYPPQREFIYGEWLRKHLENGTVPGVETDPDLAMVVANVRHSSVSLRGPEARQLLAPVPDDDLRQAISDSLPALIAGLNGDEGNVLLTLARMWRTAATGAIVPKHTAATWAIPKLPQPVRPTLELARQAYLGQTKSDWSARQSEVRLLVHHMKRGIEACSR